MQIVNVQVRHVFLSGNQFVSGTQGAVGQINEVPDLEEHNSKANNRIGN